MQYHAHALAGQGAEVDLVGFEGTPLPQAIENHPRITVHRLPPSTLRRMSAGISSAYAAAGLVDAGLRGFTHWRTLPTLRQPAPVPVPNPPTLPSLLGTDC